MLWLPFVLLGCYADKGFTSFNSSPEITITSHPEETELIANNSTTFLASVSDLNNSTSDLTVEWFADQNILCASTIPEASGDISCTAVVPIGTEIVSAVVKDPTGASGSDQIAITFANQAPEVRIISHSDGAQFTVGEEVILSALATDTEDPSENLLSIWYANGTEICPETNVLASGESICQYVPEPNTTSISIHVFDTAGKDGIDSITTSTASTEPPIVSILTPINGSEHPVNSPIVLTGRVEDPDSPLSELTLTWSSDIDGNIIPSSIPDSSGLLQEDVLLSEGTHTIQLTASDAEQNTATASIIIDVVPGNTAPTCSITSPSSNDVVGQGTSLIFTASATDAQTPSPQLDVSWSSSIDGTLGTSQASSSGNILFPYSSLSLGTHIISLNVADPEGLSCVEQIVLLVSTAPTITWNTPISGETVAENTPFSWNALISDLQDPPTSLSVSWSSNIDGVFSTQGADSSGTISFNAPLSRGSHTVTLSVTDTDGMTSSLQRNVTSNGLPTQPSVSISPNPALSSDILVASATGSTDPEGSLVTYQYQWQKDGNNTSHTGISVPPSDTIRGEIWTVIATPFDGSHTGTSAQTSVTIGNTPPSYASLSITPSPAYNDSSLLCASSISDTDGDTITETFAWSTGSINLGNSNPLVLTGTLPPQTSISCTSTASDGSSSSTQTTSTTLLNRDPVALVPSISPNTGINSGSVLTCTANASDPDNDAITTAYTWTHNGSSLGSGSTIVLPTVLSGDQISCITTVTDSFGAQDTASHTISVGNSAPEITSILLSPSTPSAQTGSIACLVSGTDADGDTITYTYAWSIDGQPQSNSSSILAGPFSHPSSITCTVTPNDGTDTGIPQSASASVSNSLPSVTGLSIAPTPAYTNSTIFANYSLVDLDSTQSPSATVAWHKISGTTAVDSIVSTNGNTLANAFFVKGDSIYLSVTPYDGFAYGTAVNSNLITISNTPPTDPSISISPSAPDAGFDDLICNVSAISTDVDGDTINYTFVWQDSSGTTVQTTTQNTLSNTFPGSQTDAGTWTCTVTATDGSNTSNTITATVSVSGACESHMDCPGALYCGEWLSDGLFHCSELCVSDDDCQSTEICAKLEGSGNVRYCTPPHPNGYTSGNFCSSDLDCESGLCINNYCESHCGGEIDCGTNESCHAVGDLPNGEASSSCGTHTGNGDIGDSCLVGNIMGGEFCETGHCDIHNADYYAINFGLPPYCRPLCSKESDCDLTGPYPEVCDIVIAADIPSDGVAIDSISDTPYNTITACYEPWQTGSQTMGTVCTSNTDCLSNKCFNIQQGSSQRFCTGLCETNSDCTGGTSCITASLNIPNEWMVNHSNFSVSQLQGMTTLVRICAF